MRRGWVRLWLTLLGLLALFGCNQQSTLPTPPSQVIATPGPGFITVSWQDNSDNETGFIIFRDIVSTSAAGNPELSPAALTELASVGPDETSFQDQTVDPASSYLYAVAAKGEAGESGSTRQQGGAVQPLPIPNTLTVTKAGSGDGNVSSSPPGIDCGNQCQADFDPSLQVSLLAQPDSGSVFVSWSGDCSDTALICLLSMDKARNAVATFDSLPPPNTKPLAVSLTGSGDGNVSSSPPGIDCGNGKTDCSENYQTGTTVTLTATPNADTVFVGWSGDCSGTSTCVLNMDAAKNVVATFETAPLLMVKTIGSGSGNVSSSPPGIDCGNGKTDCSENYQTGITVTLTATPNVDAVFVGWSGDCNGFGTALVCTLSMDAAKNALARFRLATATAITATIQDTPDGKTSNDGEEFQQDPVGTGPDFVKGTVATHTKAIDFTFDFGSELVIGLRFENLDIPPGATILSAYLQFTSFVGGAGPGDADPLSLTIKGQSDTNPATFKNATENPTVRNDITGRPATSAFVDWNGIPQWLPTDAAGPKQLTPDLGGIVQEVVDLSGWSQSSNALVFIIAKKSGTGIRRAADRRFADEQLNPDLAAKLLIDYQ